MGKALLKAVDREDEMYFLGQTQLAAVFNEFMAFI